MRLLTIISLVFLISCEKVVIIELPPAQHLLVVEGWLTDQNQIQSIQISRSNGFLDTIPVQPITDASVRVERLNGGFQPYEHLENGHYQSVDPFAGNADSEYRVVITLDNDEQIRSDWSVMPHKTEILSTSIRSFLENNPNDPSQQMTLFYPKMRVQDSAGFDNFYRWIFYKGQNRITIPESITIQDDRFFDGNLIPNTFDEFNYEEGDTVIVNLHSISESTFNFLELLKSQIATLGSSNITSPSVVDGNLTNFDSNEKVLGYFAATAVSADTVIAQ